jgi:hypothetical protein
MTQYLLFTMIVMVLSPSQNHNFFISKETNVHIEYIHVQIPYYLYQQ